MAQNTPKRKKGQFVLDHLHGGAAVVAAAVVAAVAAAAAAVAATGPKEPSI